MYIFNLLNTVLSVSLAFACDDIDLLMAFTFWIKDGANH